MLGDALLALRSDVPEEALVGALVEALVETLVILSIVYFKVYSEKKSFYSQNELINKSTGQVVSCTELKTFINNEYNKYFQNPVNYQKNNFDQNTDGGYGDVYGSVYNNGYRNGGDYSQTYGGQWGTSDYGIGNNNGNLGGYNVGGYGYSGSYG